MTMTMTKKKSCSKLFTDIVVGTALVSLFGCIVVEGFSPIPITASNIATTMMMTTEDPRHLICHRHHFYVVTSLASIVENGNNGSEEEGEKKHDKEGNSTITKPKTRLAQLAEDWLEEDDDELLQYWERFDSKNKVMETTSSASVVAPLGDDNNNLTTEERLEKYFDSRGINKQKEDFHREKIETAIRKAQKAKRPIQAIEAIQNVRPWLQINTRLGGTALIELVIALWQQSYEEEEEEESEQVYFEQEKDNMNNSRDEALLLCQELLGNAHVNRQVRQLIKNNGPPKRRQATSFWDWNFQ